MKTATVVTAFPVRSSSEKMLLYVLEFAGILAGAARLSHAGFHCVQRKNTSDAFLGTEICAADFGSELNLPNTDGFERKCRCSVSTRF